MKEQSHYNRLCAEHASKGRLFRNNVGTAYQGKMATISGQRVLSNPRFINFGLCVGSSDLIGWTEIEITPEMVGQKIAVFTAIEVKTENGKTTPLQDNFIETVRNAGGIAKVERV